MTKKCKPKFPNIETKGERERLTRWDFGTKKVHSKKSPVQADDYLDVVDETLRTPYIVYLKEVIIIYCWEAPFLKANIKEN